MTENRRIVLNIVATYGRSLYGLALGLLCGRWTLQALGETDYGLNGLVGGLTVFIAFFNGVLAGANARFYAFSVGAAKTAIDKEAALEECRKWFNTALSVHAIVPIVLILIGYPLGVYTIEHWLTIPSDRIQSCVWVFRFVCLSCFIGMIGVPYSAMYGAKQYIAELTIYSFVTSTVNVLFLHYMVVHPGVWLTKFAAWNCALSILPQVIIWIRARCIFPECRIRVGYMWNFSRLRKLGCFAGWTMLGSLCGMLRTQGISIVINKFFGARMNAAQAIGTTVQGHCNTLAGAMQGAFVPVITQACGAGDYAKMNEFVIRTCKFNVMLSMIFMVPLGLELQEVMALWLKNPPPYATGLCYCAMILHILESSTVGHCVAINATGRIVKFHVVVCSINVFTLPLAALIGFFYRNVFCVVGAVVFMQILHSFGRMYFARKTAGTSVRIWMRDVFSPLAFSIALCIAIGGLPRLVMAPSFVRVCATTLFCEAFFIPVSWFFLLSKTEREFLVSRFRPRLRQLFLHEGG